MSSAANAHVLVTGAASGMGLRYAERAVLESAASVTLWDIDPIALDDAATALSRSRTTIHSRVVDVASPEAVADAATARLNDGAAPDILINNAGIVRGNDYFWEAQPADADLTMRVNALGAMHVARQLLPAMIADAGRAKRILNIASAAGTLANPRMAAYAASKWAMVGWSDSLRLELAAAGADHVRVTTFCPSYIATGMFAGARGPLLTPVLDPDVAVDRAWRAMLRATPLRYTPWSVSLSRALRGVLPAPAWDAVAGALGVYTSMDAFTGRAHTEVPDTEEAR
ncbi:Short-chain dehydrogenase [Paramicrobacterium humi]|uniref:Short-chain dehydrogenase n=1 Tax=Paramicrobacterium humi TaxID=640635 RepID=A0A1H4INE2_9MICO|nr:SDR family NAD(P)-dependent oxidoreductase [Microbacterium humi]SEB35483.1 Short-chain dehydrogenase [Microbacterium humi]